MTGWLIVVGFLAGAITATLAGFGFVPQSIGWAGAAVAAIAGSYAAVPRGDE